MGSAAPRLHRFRLAGLVAATFTPFRPDGAVDLDRIPAVIDTVINQGATGLYVCGSTGEGPSLTTSERISVAEAVIRSAARRVPVVVQVGHNSIVEARRMASHAQHAGADAISAVPPTYYRCDSLETFIGSVAHVAAGAPKLPFYYYHIPTLPGAPCSMVEFLQHAQSRIPTLRGLKFSDSDLAELQACVEFAGRQYDILFGVDQMLLGALAIGARGAVGSTYNFAAPLYLRLIEAFEAGDMGEARKLQHLAGEMVRVIFRIGGRSALKSVMRFIGADCGYSRLPTESCSPQQVAVLRKELKTLGFFDWTGKPRARLLAQNSLNRTPYPDAAIPRTVVSQLRRNRCR